MAKLAGAIRGVVSCVAALVAVRLGLSFLGVGVPPALPEVDFWSILTGLDLSPAGTPFPAAAINCSLPAAQREDEDDPNRLHMTPVGQALYPFVLVRASRESATTFHILGLSSAVIRKFDANVAHECVWQSGNDKGLAQGPHYGSQTLATAANLSYGNTEAFKVPYKMVIATCQFEREVGVDGLGGALFLKLATSPFVGLQFPPTEALRESAGYDVRAKLAKPPPYKFAFCGAAVAGRVHMEVIEQWLIYHLYIYQGPKAHFFFYDIGGIGEHGVKVLEPFVKAGFVTILDVAQQSEFPSWYHGQVLWINECLHRTRFLAEWTIFQDFDEFLFAQPPHTVADIFQQNADAPVLTFGSWPVSIANCRPTEKDDEWPLERMLWRRHQPECRSRDSPWICKSAAGRRKYAVNPRKEFYSSIHQTLGSTWHQAVHFNASIIRLEHYQGLLAKEICKISRSRGIPIETDIHFYQEWMEEQQPGIIPVIIEARKYVQRLLQRPS